MIVDQPVPGAARVQQTNTGFQHCPYHYVSREHEEAERKRLAKVARDKLRPAAELAAEAEFSY